MKEDTIGKLEVPKNWMEKADEEFFIDSIICAKELTVSLNETATKYKLPFKLTFEFLENHPTAEKYSQYR